MLADIVELKVIGPCQLYLKFEDGVSGEVDSKRIMNFQGFCAQLQGRNYFETVTLNKELGTICWDDVQIFPRAFCTNT